MATEPDTPPVLPDRSVGVLPVDRAGASPAGNGLSSRLEAQLRARVAQLEAALEDSAGCLEDAERRASELMAVTAQLESLEETLAVIVASKSWRLTTPLRRAVERARSSARR
jgi:hypothetical protein